MVYAKTEGKPEEAVDAFFKALTEEPHGNPYQYLADCSGLGLDGDLSDRAGQLLAEAVRQSIRYTPLGPCREKHWHAEQTIELSYFNTRKMQEDLKRCVQEKVKTAAKNRDPREVYDEAYNYKESFIEEIYLSSLQQVLKDPELYTETDELTISLEYRENSGWQILADEALIQALNGKLL
ncbi:MAG: hypothetical protein MJ135_03900 [Oscillospiraceae bacterium]|nr:hypothetical protein [Oscillospiraceae bacterium]